MVSTIQIYNENRIKIDPRGNKKRIIADESRGNESMPKDESLIKITNNC